MWRGKRTGIIFLAAVFLLAGFGQGLGLAGADPIVDAERDFLYPGEFDRDPFDPLINAEGVINVRLVRQVGDLRLNGIIYSAQAEGRRAIINNTLVRHGDYIGAYKIEEIKKTLVVLNKKGTKITLAIKEEE
ncbi:general secretion pathway protein GspB [Candidatus Omnitrophota bacterium]